MKNGIRLAFRSKLFIILFILALSPFIVRAGMIVLYHSVDDLKDNLEFAQMIRADGGFYHRFLVLEQLFGVICMCLFQGAPLIARDMKSGALELYFSKPLLLADYLIGKFMTIAFFIACMTLFPALILFLLDVVLSDRPGHFEQVIGLLPRILGISVLVIGTCSMIVLAASSLARSPRNSAVIWLGFHVTLAIIALIATVIFSEINLELLNVQTSLVHLSRSIFDCPTRHDWSWMAPAAYLCFLVTGSFGILLLRVRGVDVIKS
jgi:ABC-type transport system involved in multi-copper enzyme maturation permease subunit